MPSALKPIDLLSVTFDMYNLDDSGTDPRFGVEVYFNGVKVQDQIVIRTPQLDVDYTTPQFTLASVNAVAGPGADNIVTLMGTSYNADGGGAWMGIDYVQLNQEATKLPTPKLPWSARPGGQRMDRWRRRRNEHHLVEGNGTVDPLPGSPTSTEVKGGADNDYYFAGLYTNVITANGTYDPVGLVAVNEEAAERGFAGAENELRYHFNLPNALQPSDLLAVTFGALNLDTSGADPRYGVEVWVNGVRVQPEVLIRAAQLNTPITTAQFTLATVNAKVGLGFDNIVSLRASATAPKAAATRWGLIMSS